MGERSRDASPSVEVSAKSVEEALKRAAAEFQTAVDGLQYEVIKDNTRSVLGLVRTGEVTIRVWPAESVQEKPAAQPEPMDEAPEEEQVSEGIPVTADEDEEGASSGGGANPPELEGLALDMLATLLDKMGVLAAVEVVEHGGTVDPATDEVTPLVLNIVGDDLGGLIGRRGETLRDMQFLVRLMLSRKLHAWPNLVVDVEGYKAKRVNGLRTLAHRMADQVRKTGRPAVLEPMPAHERRIIHLALRDAPDVYTESTGEDEERKVQILPKK